MSLSAAAIAQNSKHLDKLITQWRLSTNKKFQAPAPLTLQTDVHSDGVTKSVVVALRTRPFLPEELPAEIPREGDDEAAAAPLSGVLVHNPTMHLSVPTSKWNGVSITPKSFIADIAFGPEDTNEDVFRCLVKEQGLLETVLGGGVGCILAYGQTGSGKTHTISALEQQLASLLFSAAASFAAQKFPSAACPPDKMFKVQVQMWEILGNQVTDLLEPGKQVEIAEDKVGNIQITAKSIPVSTPSALSELLAKASSHRRTSPTMRNATSSRSHCILSITLVNSLFPATEPGRLVLVDLAGSERAADRAEHSKERAEEGKLINESLMCLKDCVKARATVEQQRGNGKFLHIPYRSSKLTLALKTVFDLEATRRSQMAIIAHVSPHLSDTAHSNNTLTYITPFRAVSNNTARTSSVPNPSSWSNVSFRSWASKACPEVNVAKLAPFESGLQMTRLSEDEFVKRCTDAGLSETQGQALYQALWKLIIDAKRDARPDAVKIRREPNDPEGWTHQQYKDWVEQAAPRLNPDLVCPSLDDRGFTIMKMGEAEFVSRILHAGKEGEIITEEDGRSLYKQMWSAHLESRNSARKQVMAKRANGSYNDGVEITDRLFALMPDNEDIWGPQAQKKPAGEEASPQTDNGRSDHGWSLSMMLGREEYEKNFSEF